ncbi:hypothetical protein [uncultured Nocardioides sp.]|uniref:hypothetical protein n=1 Tax=uncultured Nocardioides sp. TaxID=198441 RepID=UPI00260939E2|nr:hypothetical protein [uncultured Nocardioides sp.]
MTGFDTAVDGEPGTLRDCVRWLRGTLRGDVRDAATRQAGARRDAAGGWEGASCEAYRDVGSVALAATDDHATRIGRAADDVDAVADRMDDLRATMRGVRAEAEAAGLFVSGTVVHAPVFGTGEPESVVPGPSDQGHAGRVAAYDRLERRAATARQRAEDWIAQHLARAGERAAERDDVEVLRRRLGGPAPAGTGPVPAPVDLPALGGVGGPGAGAGAVTGGGTLAGPGGPALDPPGPGGPGGGSGGGWGGGPEGGPRWVPAPGVPRWEGPLRGEPRWEGPLTGRPRWEEPKEELPVAEPGDVPVAEPGQVPVAEPGVRGAR